MVSAVSEGGFVVDSGLGRTTVSPDGNSLLKTGLPGEQSAAADAQGMWRLDRNGSVLVRVRFDSGEVDRSFDLADAWFGSIHRGVAYLGAPDGRAFTLDLETGAIAPGRRVMCWTSSKEHRFIGRATTKRDASRS